MLDKILAFIADTINTCIVPIDHNGTKTQDATSGTDKDLFNAIRALGWYDDVIS